MIERSASIANIGNPSNTKDTSKVTMRVPSTSHATSHAKAVATQGQSPKGKGRVPGTIPLPPPIRNTPGQSSISPRRPGLDIESDNARATENVRQVISLNSPPPQETSQLSPIDLQPSMITRAEGHESISDEREVAELASPAKEDGYAGSFRRRDDIRLEHVPQFPKPVGLGFPQASCRLGESSPYSNTQFYPFARMGDTTYRRLEETQVSILEEQRENREWLSQIADGIGQSNALLAEMISELQQNRRSPSMGSYRGRSPNPRRVSLHTLNETAEQNDENEEETSIHHQDAVDPPQNEEETDMDLFPRLVRSGEMDALIQLKILEYKRDASTGSRLIAHRRGNRETSPDYETRLYNTASNFILTELHSGVNVNVLFERLSPLRRQARFEDARPNTRATSSNTLHVRPDRRVNELSKNTSR